MAKLFSVEDMRQAKPDSPRISHLSWGRIEVEGHLPFKDAKIFPGGAREWDWRETGTRHVPGIQPADVQELIEHGARTVVLSKGVWERLQVCPETLEVLSKNDIQVEVLQTEAAVERFNELRENIAVGGLFHSTCSPLSSGSVIFTPSSGLEVSHVTQSRSRRQFRVNPGAFHYLLSPGS